MLRRSSDAVRGRLPLGLLAEVYHPHPFESGSILGALLMNIHMAAAALYPVLCNYHFKGSQMLIRLEHDLKKLVEPVPAGALAEQGLCCGGGRWAGVSIPLLVARLSSCA